jgi:hypothetical protein
VQEAIRLGCSVVVVDVSEEKWRSVAETEREKRRIDVWWRGDKTSHLMLLLAYLVTRVNAWHDARIRVVGGSSEEARQKAEASLQTTLEEVRIDAEVEVVTAVSPGSVLEHSRDAALVFFPLYYREWGIFESAEESFEPLVERLPIIAWVLAADDVNLDAGPDEGEIGEAAAILDKARDLAETARVAEAEAAALEKKVTEALDARSGEEPTEEERENLRELRRAAQAAATLAQEQRRLANAAAEEARALEEAAADENRGA